MDNKKDKTRILLEQLLNEVHKEQSIGPSKNGESYLIAQDDQFLGKITKNKYDNDSLLNKYGPYGSKYSSTSIFNPYSQYGSKYGSYSINNPYCSQPPKLFINGKFKDYVTTNRFISAQIPTDTFLYYLNNDIENLLKGNFNKTIQELKSVRNESFILAHDGTFIGSLEPNEFSQDSIFNQFGPYGSEFSQTSIFNQFSKYGSEFSALSPFNEFSLTPPKIYVHGKFVAYLTENQLIAGNKIDPKTIKEWARQNV